MKFATHLGLAALNVPVFFCVPLNILHVFPAFAIAFNLGLAWAEYRYAERRGGVY